MKKLDQKYSDSTGNYTIGFKSTLGCDESYIEYKSVSDMHNYEPIAGNFTCNKW